MRDLVGRAGAQLVAAAELDSDLVVPHAHCGIRARSSSCSIGWLGLLMTTRYILSRPARPPQTCSADLPVLGMRTILTVVVTSRIEWM